jgi:L-fuconolactonase
MPDFPIVDSHVHLYDPTRLPFSWMKGSPILDSAHGVAEFDAERGGVAVEKLVFVEVAVDDGHHVGEARTISALAQNEPRLAGLVVHAPLQNGAAVEADLETLAALPSVKGVRRLIQGEPDPGFCLEPNFHEGMKLLKKFGFSFDICVKSFALTYGLELARRHPDVPFILDHIGKPDIRHGLVEPWRSQIRALAALPNVVAKISGVITEAHPERRGVNVLRPYILETVEAFGFDRLLFGGDWPVSALTHRYADWVAVLDEVLAGASADELRKFYRSNAERVYRL